MQIPFNFTPYPHQAALFAHMNGEPGKPETAKRRAFLRWHRRAGKDKASFCYMITKAAMDPGNYYYVFPQLSDARRALWENIDGSGFRTIEHIPQMLIKRKREDEMSIELFALKFDDKGNCLGIDETSQGSIIRLLGLDNPDKIRGISAKGVVFSEFAYQPEEGYKIFMPALRETKGWAIFNSTPNGKNHYYELEERIKDSPNWYFSCLQTMWEDKPFYSGLRSKQDLKEIQFEEGFTDAQMDQEYGVSYTTTSTGIYYNEQLLKAQEENRIGHFPYNSSFNVDTFWDIGISDDVAIWFVQYEGSRINLIDYHEDNNKYAKDYAEVLKGKGYKYRTHFLPHDGDKRNMVREGTVASELEKCCITVGVDSDIYICDKPNSVMADIQKLRGLMGRMHFNEPKVSKGIQRLQNYKAKFNKIMGVFSDEPMKNGNQHAADALRTMVVAPFDRTNKKHIPEIKMETGRYSFDKSFDMDLN